MQTFGLLPLELISPIVEYLLAPPINEKPINQEVQAYRDVLNLALTCSRLYTVCDRYLSKSIAIHNDGYQKFYYRDYLTKFSLNSKILEHVVFRPLKEIPVSSLKNISNLAFYFVKGWKINVVRRTDSGYNFDTLPGISWQTLTRNNMTPNLKSITLGIGGGLGQMKGFEEKEPQWVREIGFLNRCLQTRPSSKQDIKVHLIFLEPLPSVSFYVYLNTLPVTFESLELESVYGFSNVSRVIEPGALGFIFEDAALFSSTRNSFCGVFAQVKSLKIWKYDPLLQSNNSRNGVFVIASLIPGLEELLLPRTIPGTNRCVPGDYVVYHKPFKVN